MEKLHSMNQNYGYEVNIDSEILPNTVLMLPHSNQIVARASHLKNGFSAFRQQQQKEKLDDVTI